MAARAAPDDKLSLRAEAESSVPALTESEIQSIVREVTAEEVAHYAEFGAHAQDHCQTSSARDSWRDSWWPPCTATIRLGNDVRPGRSGFRG